MADNYLEKKYEDFQKSRNVTIRKVNPSLDSLISKNACPQTATETDYKVKKAQMDAMLATAGRLGIDFSGCSDEGAASLTINCRDSFSLGRVCLAAELKAIELRLSTKVELKENADKEFPAGAIIHVFR